MQEGLRTFMSEPCWVQGFGTSGCDPALVWVGVRHLLPVWDTWGCSCASQSCSSVCVMLCAFCKSLRPWLQKREGVCKGRESPRL